MKSHSIVTRMSTSLLFMLWKIQNTETGDISSVTAFWWCSLGTPSAQRWGTSTESPDKNGQHFVAIGGKLPPFSIGVQVLGESQVFGNTTDRDRTKAGPSFCRRRTHYDLPNCQVPHTMAMFNYFLTQGQKSSIKKHSDSDNGYLLALQNR